MKITKTIFSLLILSSVLTVRAEVVTVYGSAMQGSGVVIGKNKVLTNCHLFKDEYVGSIAEKNAPPRHKFQVKENYFTGARVLAGKDLCLIEPNTSRFENSEIETNYSLGDDVQSVNFVRDNQGKILDIIKNTNTGVDLIGTDSTWKRGASGGGLFNKNGKLIGITTYITTNRGVDVFWAVGVNDIEKIFQEDLVKKVKIITLYSNYKEGVVSGL